MPSRFTLYDLKQITDFLGFESLCVDIMSRYAFPGIQPLGGYKDKGRDALHFAQQSEMTTIFAFSTEDGWEGKLRRDFKKIEEHGHELNQFVFVTTDDAKPSEIDNQTDELAKKEIKLDVWDVKRIATFLDNEHPDLKSVHSNIFHFSTSIPDLEHNPVFSREAYLEFIQASYSKWVKLHTPLLAEHREFDTFVNLKEDSGLGDRLPIVDIPRADEVAVLIGESGTGKTTSLWQIAVDRAEQPDGHIPVIVPLRNWSDSNTCRNLVDNALEVFTDREAEVEKLLSSGEMLVMFDGLNEVETSKTNDCRYDIALFASKYRHNQFVVTCRTSDYSSSRLPLGDVSPPLPEAKIYEICRLGRTQIIDYANSYLEQKSPSAEGFLHQLAIYKDSTWQDESATVQLARIPLFLQTFLDAYVDSGSLPDSQADLLVHLVHRLFSQTSKSSDSLSESENESTLGLLSYTLAEEGYALQFPKLTLDRHLEETVVELAARQKISPDLTAAEAWAHISSCNFIRLQTRSTVEWLHQLIRDYYLGTEFARRWESGQEPFNWGSRWDVAYSIALSLVDDNIASRFILQLITMHEETARRTYETQSTRVKVALAESIVSGFLIELDHESKFLETLAIALPHAEIADAIFNAFFEADESMHEPLVRALVGIVIEHKPSLAYDQFEQFLDQFVLERRRENTRRAVDASESHLRRLLKNKNENIAFYAAKGLWEEDRELSISRLRDLGQSTDPAIRSLVKDLIEDWGIQ